MRGIESIWVREREEGFLISDVVKYENITLYLYGYSSYWMEFIIYKFIKHTMTQFKGNTKPW